MIETRFKDTEIGRIPKDWEIKDLRCFLSLLTDYDANGSFADMAENVKTYDGFGYAWYVRATDLEQNTSLSKVKYTDKQSYDFLKKSSLFGGEVLVAKRGDIGKVYMFEMRTCKATLAPNLYLLKLNGTIEPYYLYLFLKNGIGNKLLKGINASTSLGAIYKEDVKSLPVIVAPIPEQKRIVSALSSIDNLISSFDKLIEKKKNIKQGAMQQLLTGKKRLKGFSEPWIKKQLGDLLQYEQPTKYLVSSTEYSDNGVPVLTAGKTFILGYTNETYGIYTNLPVIIFDDFVTESKYVDFPFKAKSSAMKMLTLRGDDNNLRFVFELMQMIDFPMTDHKRWWIGEYCHIMVKVPSLMEQNAIASVLTSMDNEISALESKKAKYESIKQGMMQQLLTGKIRLI